MSELSKKLEEFKQLRNLNICDIAKECHMDISTIFRWMNGERKPSNIVLLQRLGKAMHLTVQEMDELEIIYKNNLWGEKYKQYQACVDVIRAVKDGEQYIKDENTRIIMQESFFYDDGTISEQNGTGLPLFEQASREYQIYALLKKFWKYIKVNNITNIRIMTRLVNGEISWIVRLLFWNLQGVNIEQIISMDEVIEEAIIVNKLKVLEIYIGTILQHPNMKVYINQNMYTLEQLNWIICDDAVLLFNSNLQEAVLATDKAFVQLYNDMYDECLGQSMVIDAKRLNVNDYFENMSFEIGTIIRSFEYQPCVSSGLSYKILNQVIHKEIPERGEMIRFIYETFSMCSKNKEKYRVETYFTEDGMDDFCQNGIINVFQYPIYRALNEEERKEVIHNIISISEKEYNRHCLIQNEELEDIKNVHIQYLCSEKQKYVKLEFFITEQETLRFHIEDEDIIQGFVNFFDCLEHNKVKNKEETIKYMKKKLEEYFSSR